MATKETKRRTIILNLPDVALAGTPKTKKAEPPYFKAARLSCQDPWLSVPVFQQVWLYFLLMRNCIKKREKFIWVNIPVLKQKDVARLTVIGRWGVYFPEKVFQYNLSVVRCKQTFQ